MEYIKNMMVYKSVRHPFIRVKLDIQNSSLLIIIDCEIEVMVKVGIRKHFKNHFQDLIYNLVGRYNQKVKYVT